jgi:hypothetical protein
MNQNLIAQGYLLKKEKLANYTSDEPFNEMLLENLDPFPGFYERYFIPTNVEETKPISVFMVIRDFGIDQEDDFKRITSKIAQHLEIPFQAALSNITLFNRQAIAIRVIMDDYGKLPSLISEYQKVGIEFHSRRQVNPYVSLIKIHRFFELEEIEDGIYCDTDREHTYLIRIPAFLNWDKLVEASEFIRNNWIYKSFDTAQAAIYLKSGIMELVRVYDKNATPETLRFLKLKFAQFIANNS